MEGLDAISYWHRSGRFIPGILPVPTHVMASSEYVDAMSDLILNSRLPVGLVAIGLQSIPEYSMSSTYKDGLLRMRRLGALLHFLNFSGSVEQLQWVEEMQMDGVHIDMTQLRNEMLPFDALSQIRRPAYSSTQIYASNIALVKDIENAAEWQIDYCYGGLMMPPLSRHQTLQINDSRIAKAIFSLHPHQHPKQNGDK